MRVVFLLWGEQVREAKMMVKSVKRLGYEVWQLSDEKAPEVPLVDKVLRKPKDMPSMAWKFHRLAELDFPYCSLDNDILVKQDISSGLDPAYDASLTWRPNKEAEEMSYNAGVMFINNQQFMRAVADEIMTMPEKQQEWLGDQVALHRVAESGRFKIQALRSAKWNWTPPYYGAKSDGVLVYHFKGTERKDWMPRYL